MELKCCLDETQADSGRIANHKNKLLWENGQPFGHISENNMKNYILTISYSMFMDVRMYMRYVEANNWFCKMVTDCGTPINGQSIKNQIKQWAHCGLQLQKKQLNGQNQFYMTRKYYHIVYELCVCVCLGVEL